MGKFLINLIVEWFKQSQVAKGAVTVAMGSSIGYVAIIGYTQKQIDTASAATDIKIESSKKEIYDKMMLLKSARDDQYQQIREELKYQRGAIDATRDSVLDVLKEVKKK